MSIQVVKCQTKVKTIIGNISAIITGICIRHENISYEISYFNQGIDTECWLMRYEFEIDNQEKKKAGLVDYNTEDDSVYNQLLIE